VDGESFRSRIQTVLAETPHGWRLTPSFWTAVLARIF